MKIKIFNRGLSFSTKLMLLITAAATVIGACIEFRTGLVILILSLIMTAVHFISENIRNEKIESISEDIDGILHGCDHIVFDRYSEGELSILESEISKMTVRLREQQSILKADKIYLADSLADISHQLRTPLTSMNLIVSMLARPQTTEAKKNEMLRETSELLRQVDWLLTALLKISKLDAGTVRFRTEEISLEELLRKACTPVQIPIELREQRLIVEADGSFSGDILWTCEAILNIVKNCMEHTPDGGEIRVTGADNPIYTEIVVKDTGTGISPEDLPHIFERFYKGSDSGDKGFGIGLALAKKIIVSQNGTIKAGNRPESGAEFTIRFYKSTV